MNAVAVEADWPAAYRVNCFVRGAGKDRTAADALGDFLRFPRWMWRNQVVEAFAMWLRAHNEHAVNPVGFYGLDLYSLHESVDLVLRYLEKVDPRPRCAPGSGTPASIMGTATTAGLRRGRGQRSGGGLRARGP